MLEQPPMVFTTDTYAYDEEERARRENAREEGNCNIRPGQRKRIERLRNEQAKSQTGNCIANMTFDLGTSAFGNEPLIQQFVGVSPQSDRSNGNWQLSSHSMTHSQIVGPNCLLLNNRNTVTHQSPTIFQERLAQSSDDFAFQAQQAKKFNAAMGMIAGEVLSNHVEAFCSNEDEKKQIPGLQEAETTARVEPTNFLLSQYE